MKSDGTFTNDLTLVNRVKDKLSEARAKFATIRLQVEDHEKKIGLIQYANDKDRIS